MTTGIVKSPHLATFIPDDQYGIVADLHRQILPGFFNLKGMPDKNPLLVPYLLKILTENFGFYIQLTRKRVARLALLNQVDHGCLDIHYYPLHTNLTVNGKYAQKTVSWPTDLAH
jgi:hypothetical protein